MSDYLIIIIIIMVHGLISYDMSYDSQECMIIMCPHPLFIV